MPPADRYKYFRVEARELLEGLQQGALELEKQAEPQAAVRSLLRHAHTLKGAARVVRLPAIADLAHAVEEALAPLRDAGQPGPGLVDQLLGLLDGISAGLDLLDQAPTGPAAGAAPGAEAAPAKADERRLDTVRLELAELDAVLEGLREAVSRLGLLRSRTGSLAQARRLTQGLVVQAGDDPRTRATAQELGSLLERFDRLANEGLEQAERGLVESQERAARLRLLPVASLFSYLERVCRDAASALGKSVRFEADGGDSRLDGAVLGALQEALQHVVRNAVAHGLEEPAARRAAGKSEQGSVRVSLRREAGRLIFVCADDGRGLDLGAVRAAAERRGLRAPESESDAIELLLRGGLSTAPQVSELAGRGLGLDVLREAVGRLKGGLSLRNHPGQGLELEVSVPASLSTFPALAVDCGGHSALIPFDAVREALRLRGEDLSSSPEGESLRVGGRLLPFAPLAACLGLEGGRPRTGIRVSAPGGEAVLGVDRVLGVREAVVLPPPALAPRSALSSGASLDSAGEPCLVLDPEGLVRAAQAHRAPAEAAVAVDRPPLLVVDDSLTTRMLEKSILETAGYEVDLAVSAEDGLEQARARRYGLVLVDVEMPGMDGFAFVESLGRDPQLRQLPAILVSSRASSEDKRRGLAAGARDYIVKGEFDQGLLLNRIRELLP